MPTEKIGDAKLPCNHPEHFPPNNMLFEPGKYKHTCPACGNVITFEVPRPTW